MPHRNAPLTETGRLRLARCVVEDDWPLRRAAERFQVSPTTARRWADRYRQLGEAGMSDRSSRPRTSPRRTPTRTERRIIKVRCPRRWGPARIAHPLHLVPSTVHRVLTRFGLARLTQDEKKETATGFWTRAHTFFTECGITVERVLTDNGSCYRSCDWRDALAAAGITHKRTRPHRPQTNGKVERFNRTLLDEWAYARPYRSEAERREAFPRWLHTYNHHRGHTALKGQPPASRVPNLTGQYT
ncbi:integrase core domain-containing protein [Streptomyces sp. NPDC047706]|uniref:integrase core domain-containing protein n=1 Tax=Streptomyces sp. NPDC047706 TaxID=3365486 RepID=UPI00371B8420